MDIKLITLFTLFVSLVVLSLLQDAAAAPSTGLVFKEAVAQPGFYSGQAVHRAQRVKRFVKFDREAWERIKNRIKSVSKNMYHKLKIIGKNLGRNFRNLAKERPDY